MKGCKQTTQKPRELQEVPVPSAATMPLVQPLVQVEL